MKISIVIPAFNEERLLADTLRSVKAALAPFGRRGWATELIVCDNNSTDRTAEVARVEGAAVVFEPLNQIARARNSGAAAATGDWLLFVDADSHPSEALIEEVATAIASGRCLAGGATVRLDGHHPKAALVTHLWNAVSRLCRWVAGSFIFCETAAFRKVGGFSTELFASEEINLSKRLKQFAKTDGRKVVIVHRHPILTSARKVELYTVREHVAFLIRLMFTPWKTLGNRDACHTWYDGRR